jgi:predicted ArsR family transcriptional regulator
MRHNARTISDPSTRAHRALAAVSRVRIVQVLRAAPDGLDARQISERVGLHYNTVRAHLEVLIATGMVSRRVEERSVPGRPRVIFDATEEAPREERSDYLLLATILADHVAGPGDGPSAVAEELGRRWGTQLIAPPFDDPSADEAIGRLAGLFAELGFQPEMAGGAGQRRMLLRHCPFRELAEARPDVVCSIHLGLLRGALSELGAPISATALEPFVEPSLCVAHLDRSPP